MKTFRILHFSDTHFCATPNRKSIVDAFDDPPVSAIRYLAEGRISFFPSSYDPDVAESAARFIFERQSSIDVVSFSGDAATTGKAADLRVASRFFLRSADSYIEREDSTIGFIRKRVVIAPGNHDRFTGNGGLPGGRNFDLIFRDMWNVVYPGVKTSVFCKGDEKLVFIAADFTLQKWNDALPPSYPFYLGQGRAYNRTIDLLSHATEAAKAEFGDVAILWIVHFPCHKECDSTLKLVEAEKVVEIAGKLSVSAILSGHLHKASTRSLDNGVNIITAASACSAANRRDCWMHMLEIKLEEGLIQNIDIENFLYKDSVADFRRSGPITSLSYKTSY